MSFKKITESPSDYRHLDKMSVHDLLVNMNREDKKVPELISAVIPQIEILVNAIADKMLQGGRLFYIGAGTSGRLGILDASECPPTFGVSYGEVIAIIAGGKKALTEAVEFAEDDQYQGWEDLKEYNISEADIVIGIAASGSTPYVLHALEKCLENNILTGCICCNPGSPIGKLANFPIEIVVGPEFITGSTRLKSGTAQKLILNMISNAVMIRLGRVEDNKMLNMQLANEKLIDRAVKMVMEHLKMDDYSAAKKLLLEYGNVKKLFENHHL